MNSEFLPWLTALHLSNIGPIKFLRLLTHFNKIDRIFSASQSEFEQLGLSPQDTKTISNPPWRLAEKDLQLCKTKNYEIITIEDPRYPALLTQLPDPPLVLFTQGNTSLLNSKQLAIVGTRNPTPIGKELAEQFAYTLATAGLTITSGLALGIDAASHQGALAAKGGTIAVLGTGLNKIYPHRNIKLAAEIIEKGLLLTEFPPQTAPAAQNFPRRNRIISGLSLGTLVIEAAIRSGSLITARFAAEQGREVFAIPGSVHNPLVRGCHHLIQQGAKLVEKASDILEELNILPEKLPEKSTPNSQKLTKAEYEFLNFIGYEPTPLETIIIRSRLTAAQVSSMLLSLELQSYVQLVPGGYTRKLK